MANKKFTDLATKTTAAAADVVAIVDTGSNQSKQTTVGGLATAVAVSLPAGSIGNIPLAPLAVKATNVDFSTIMLGICAPLAATFVTSSTNYVDVTGMSVTCTIPSGVTMVKISTINCIGDANVNSGSYQDTQIIDESSNQIALYQMRNVSSSALVYPLTAIGVADVTAGTTKTFKVRTKIDGSGSTVQVFAGSRLLVEAIA